MAKNYVQEGNVLTLIAPQGGVTSGVPVVIGDLFVIPVVSAKATERFAGSVVNVWALPKFDAAEEIAQGSTAYWQVDGNTSGVTANASYDVPGDADDDGTVDEGETVEVDNKPIGHFSLASPEDAETAEVRLNGSI